ncbi:hypothetical protein Q9L42_019070 [Methylomarinum sp. Ch1-1]|uniref:Uncharacterized protein n=1 Tax=Methylomarinum roseum TaxID=3067653 RepID=A0AAU7NTT1_9GAMM|nr:hypothetical protein [Methylomarinum sp. Ch1-1]MDP4519505.1 hypothetical protein [Methylomarinum sp. Ch1-1]
MLKIKNMLSLLLFSILMLPPCVALAKTTTQNSWASLALIESGCPADSEQSQKLDQLKHAIVSAESVQQARSLALAPTESAIEAINNARALMPFSDELRNAEMRLSETRSRILLASSQTEVADEFSGMMLASLDDDNPARVNVGNTTCNYSTGEIIAIVLGLILGIIPGLILLFLLC